MKFSEIRSILVALLAMLMICMAAVACDDDTTNDGEGTTVNNTENKTEDNNNNNNENNNENNNNENNESKSYTIKFMDGDKLISETTAKTGEFVDLPDDLVSEDPSVSFAGWVGIDESDWQEGKVEVFSSDMTYQANWYTGFGTAKQFNAKKLSGSITLDGDKDAAYDATDAIEISTVVAGDPGARATAYIMWDDTHYYIFIDVTDSTYYPYTEGQSEVWDADGIEFRMDLLHSSDLVPDYSADGWGGSYRGEPGPMVEAGFRLGAGVQLPEGTRFDGKGSLTLLEWWSNHIKDNGNSKGISKAKADGSGYTVEYMLEVFDTATDEIYRPHEGQVIGFGIKIFDKIDDAGKGQDNRICLEEINDRMDGDARALSNIKLVG